MWRGATRPFDGGDPTNLDSHDTEDALVPALSVLRAPIPLESRARGFRLVHEVVDERHLHLVGRERLAVDAFHLVTVIVLAQLLLAEEMRLRFIREWNRVSATQPK